MKPAEREKKTAPIEQIEKLEKEMSQVQEKYQEAESESHRVWWRLVC